VVTLSGEDIDGGIDDAIFGGGFGRGASHGL
jgi:hypothetical protein